MKRGKQNKIIKGKSIEFNRKALEDKKTKVLILQHKRGKDSLKQRDSGLNQVLAKIARDNEITLALDLNEIKKAKDKKTKTQILARIIQNIKLIKKYKNKFKLLNCKNKQQGFSFLISLGLDTEKAKKAIQK